MYRQISKVVVAVLALATFACTDVDLQAPLVPPQLQAEVKENSLSGSFCTEDPATIVFPLKVFFVIDQSGSMNQNDPNRARFTSTKALAQRLASPSKVFFGGSIFNDGSRTFTTPRFTDDLAAFNASVDVANVPGNGATPYLAALNNATAELTADIDANPAIARRTRYVVIFLSDGAPTDVPAPVEETIKGSMGVLMALKNRSGGITVNTVFLGGDVAAATAILRAMALQGEGIFKSFPNGDTLDFSGFDFSTIRRTFTHRMFVVTNRSMVPTELGQLIDSDTDGVSDKEELEDNVKSDPTKSDTDGDGCNDLVERRLGWNPTQVGGGQCTCSTGEAARDSDKDGLNDCEERWLGSKPLEPDSDLAQDGSVQGDLVPDGLDFTYLDDVLFANTTSDGDVDGVADLQELREHTTAEKSDKNRELNAYRYPRFTPRPDETRCVDFQVDNITLGRTLAAGDRAADENLLEMYFAESPQDDPHKDRIFRVARKKVKYVEGGLNIDVLAKDFSELLVPQGPTAPAAPAP
jgi:hypothetical protein